MRNELITVDFDSLSYNHDAKILSQNMQHKSLGAGARVLIRDAEWRVKRIDTSSFGGKALTCVGLSELVKDREAIFLDDLEEIEIVDPAETVFVQDDSPQYKNSFLYLESLLRQTPPTDNNIYVGHRAAMDPLEYQLEPAIKALKQPRQRILIADAVGLGKTLEAGILVSELIKRGRGRRILCLTMKSMLTQFQKEFWTRFSIPLVRLDSTGIQRIRRKIPSNHNPFYYFDKSIISIDTLKQDKQYRTHLEDCYWDIIIIDEAQNVAHRGDKKSMRARLAELLADRSDTMIMLSATPHDGKPESFASLMKMLNPTSIADEQNYEKEDIKGLFIRRFKKDIEHQVQQKFKERVIHKEIIEASTKEDQAFEALNNLTFKKLDEGRGAGQLFRTTLEKALLSSPAACLETIQNRIKRVEKKEDPALEEDLKSLYNFEDALNKVAPGQFSKYQHLVKLLKDKSRLGWDPKQSDDRIVIFTERIKTMHFLREMLAEDLNLSDKAITVLHGSMSDVEQQEVVEQFGNQKSSLRVLVASDVASEGINLHYQSHKLIHFDIPWSLMVFQQRNGRIDRYGQKNKPQIYYLVQESSVPKIKADKRILELLIDKDEHAQKNIGDSSVFMGEYDSEQEEQKTAKGIEEGMSDEEFETRYLKEDVDLLSQLMGGEESTELDKYDGRDDYIDETPSLYSDDFAFVEEVLQSFPERLTKQVDIDKNGRMIVWTLPEELRDRYEYLPDEIQPKDWRINLTDRKERIQKEIERARESEEEWPVVDYLWELHPAVRWMTDKTLNAYGRKEAPVIEITDDLEPGAKIIVCSGSYPNRKGQPVLHKWCAAYFGPQDETPEIWSFDKLIERLHLRKRNIPNRKQTIATDEIREKLPQALEETDKWLDDQRDSFEEEMNDKLQKRLTELEEYRDKQLKQLGMEFSDEDHMDKEQRRYKKMMDEYMEWIEDTMMIEKKPHIQVAAAFVGK